jgi:6-phosphogluconolactonase/glucosamine-6-phosphate isomerase/deaminase
MLMSFVIKTTTNIEDPANFIVASILNKLELGKRVLFFATGGSSIAICVKVAELLCSYPHQNLIKNLAVTLTDERYGPIRHPDSNWQQLLETGFSLPGALFLPVLYGEGRDTTVKNFNVILEKEFKKAEYKIGLFGVGVDGHTSGILPESSVNSEDLAYGYDTPTFSRITITPKAIEQLDEAVAWVQGENKWNVIESLQEKDIDIAKQPAQVLKRVPLLTIFTDYKNK